MSTKKSKYRAFSFHLQPQVHMMGRGGGGLGRSPSTSPSRPPRSRSSPTRDMMGTQGIRRAASRSSKDLRPPPPQQDNNYRSVSRERQHPVPPARRERSNDNTVSARRMSATNSRYRKHILVFVDGTIKRFVFKAMPLL